MDTPSVSIEERRQEIDTPSYKDRHTICGYTYRDLYRALEHRHKTSVSTCEEGMTKEDWYPWGIKEYQTILNGYPIRMDTPSSVYQYNKDTIEGYLTHG